MQLNRDIVKRVVIEAFLDRGLQPRRGAKVEVLLGDYASGLDGIPEKPLEQAMSDVIRDWQFPGWPSVADIRKSAAKYVTLPGEDGVRSSAADPELSRRNKAAYDYARDRMLVDNAALMMRTMAHGPWLRQQIGKFLVERAQAQLKGGALHAHVSNADVEAEIASLVGEQDKRTASQLAVQNKGPRKPAPLIQAAKQTGDAA